MGTPQNSSSCGKEKVMNMRKPEWWIDEICQKVRNKNNGKSKKIIKIATKEAK